MRAWLERHWYAVEYGLGCAVLVAVVARLWP